MYIDMMQQIFSSTTKVMVEQRNGTNLLYLPLDKLIQGATVPATGDAAKPATGAEQATPAAAAANSRDARNSRGEREERP
jgi:membrane protease subunit HflK